MLFFYLALVCFLALIYPYVLYPIVLLFFKKRPYRPGKGAALPPGTRVALLFCAHNEEATLPAKIENIREIKKRLPDLEVRAYTDCCTDASVDILRQAGDAIILHEGKTRTGKVEGMRRLVDATSADILIFTDANVIVDPDSVPRLVAYFADPQIGTVAGTLHYTNPEESPSALTNSAYWRLEETIKRLESETGSTMGADGSLFATRRSAYPYVPPELIDDMIASINPLFIGLRVVSAPDVHAFETAVVSGGEEFRRKRRIACGAFSAHRYLRPQLRSMSPTNRFKYFSHKYLRWFSGAFLVLCALFTVAGLVALGHGQLAWILAAAGLSVLWIGSKFHVPLVSALTEIAMSMLATVMGVMEAVAGRTYRTWTPPVRG